jgi:hypothetical protein
LAAAALYSSGLAGQGGNSAASAGVVPVQSSTPGTALGSAGHTLAAISNQSGNTVVYQVDTTTGTSTPKATYAGKNSSGASLQPGTRNLFISGGMTDGGNIYLAAGTDSVLVGPSGFSAISGLAWNPAGTTLYGTVTVSVLADGVVTINPLTGAATLLGPMGGGIGGIDSLAFNPATGVLFGSTGFFFDGSPGDEITINPATGAATKTGVMTPAPSCTVAGMDFDSDGTGYVSIGCGAGSGGNVYAWNPTTNQITLIVNASGSAGSVSAVEVIR